MHILTKSEIIINRLLNLCVMHLSEAAINNNNNNKCNRRIDLMNYWVFVVNWVPNETI